ncbi:hypothetical protein MBANPS3_002361 [Mucor bainieri]
MTEENQQKQPTSPNEQEGSPPAYRVKLYQLNQDTNWEDKGTGFCVYQVGKDGEPDQLIVHAEEKENSVLLSSFVEKRRLYQRQQDTLIVWTESDSRDLALSFQDPVGCEEVWQCIVKGQDGGRSNIAGDDESEVTPPARQSPEMTSLPDPELSNLKEIADIFTAAHTLTEKDKISTFITIENYFDKILPMFETCEDLEDITDLHLLYKVIIGLLALNDQGLIEQLLRDEYIIGFMGILEYNPNTPGMKAKHREFIKSHGNAKQVVDLADESIKRKIDQTFRLEYLQGILQSGGDADEGLLGVLNNMIFQNHAEIVNHIQNNHIFLGELFQIVRNNDTTEEKRNETIRFVHQLCALTKQMQNSVRVSLYRSLADYGLFDMMHFSLVDKERSIRIASLNILAAFTDLDVNCVRGHLLLQSKDKRTTTPLISTIVEQFTADAHHDLKVQYFEILRLLLDPNGNSPGGPMMSDPLKQAPETDEFLQLFYDKYMKVLLKPIEQLEIKPITLKGLIEPLVLTQDQAQLCLYICEFLYFAIRNHGFRSKYILLSSDVFVRVMQLYRSKYAYIKLGGLRFFRVCVSICDEFYNRSLIKNNIFEATIRVLLDTKGQDCLLNSACLDLLEFIRKENIKMLVNHLITQFGTVLDTITYITTCQQLREKHKENISAAASSDDKMDEEAVSSDKTEKKDNHDGWSSSTVDYDEEEYFNGSDEEETSPATQIPPKSDTVKVKMPLVNYEDDEDDDEDLSVKDKSTDTKKEKSEPMALEESSNTSLKRKHPDEDQESEDYEPDTAEADATTKEKDGSLSPPPFKSRRRSIDDDDEEDVLAKRSALSPSSSPRQSPLTKKIVIKTSTIEKMRSQ